MKNNNNKFFLIVLALVLVTAIALKIFTPSNRWICEGGEWVKQGNPKTEKPSGECDDPFSMKKEMEQMAEIFNDNEAEDSDSLSPADVDENINEDEIAEPELQELDNNDVELVNPQIGEVIQSPYQISGLARGTWYFEASFPIILKDSNGVIIAETYAQAQSDWMTEDMVPFIAELNYTINSPQVGTLILKKDNPSDLPEHDAEISYSIILN